MMPTPILIYSLRFIVFFEKYKLRKKMLELNNQIKLQFLFPTYWFLNDEFLTQCEKKFIWD